MVTGHEDAEDAGVVEQLAAARRDDGGPLFPRETAWATLVFFVLAMQCLPTLAVTARETGHVKWALLQFVWMNCAGLRRSGHHPREALGALINREA
jgi:ferrous iron transport protein B